MDEKPKQRRDHSRRKLTPMQDAFIQNYLSGMGVKASALAAGYSEKCAQVKGSEILKRQNVKRLVDETREKIVNRAIYNVATAMDELDAAIKFARETKNAAAMAKSIEIKAKLAGLLQDKNPAASAAFQINIVGIDQPIEPPMVTIEAGDNV